MNDFTYYNDEWNPPIEGTSPSPQLPPANEDFPPITE